MVQNSLSFSRDLPKKPSCEIISKSVHRFSRSRLKLFSTYSPGSHFVQQRGTVYAIFIDRNLPVKIFQNLSTDLAEEVIKSFFLFIALVAILFNGAEPSEYFWERISQGTFL